uniref:CSON001316 protein n=1 Tax=Culicoides sonorensis TaxID=179676 RepID=A0A336LMG3_CULSO
MSPSLQATEKFEQISVNIKKSSQINTRRIHFSSSPAIQNICHLMTFIPHKWDDNNGYDFVKLYYETLFVLVKDEQKTT